MKVALLVILALGLIALAQATPLAEQQLMEQVREHEDSNSVVDANCDRTDAPDSGDDSADGATASSSKKGKGRKEGKGKKDKKDKKDKSE